METIKPDTRRNFLLAASLGGAGVIAAAATARIQPRAAAVAQSDAEQKSAYRASPHILKYYKTTEF
jgi:hypothetical protein